MIFVGDPLRRPRQCQKLLLLEGLEQNAAQARRRGSPGAPVCGPADREGAGGRQVRHRDLALQVNEPSRFMLWDFEKFERTGQGAVWGAGGRHGEQG